MRGDWQDGDHVRAVEVTPAGPGRFPGGGGGGALEVAVGPLGGGGGGRRGGGVGGGAGTRARAPARRLGRGGGAVGGVLVRGVVRSLVLLVAFWVLPPSALGRGVRVIGRIPFPRGYRLPRPAA